MCCVLSAGRTGATGGCTLLCNESPHATCQGIFLASHYPASPRLPPTLSRQSPSQQLRDKPYPAASRPLNKVQALITPSSLSPLPLPGLTLPTPAPPSRPEPGPWSLHSELPALGDPNPTHSSSRVRQGSLPPLLSLLVPQETAPAPPPWPPPLPVSAWLVQVPSVLCGTCSLWSTQNP